MSRWNHEPHTPDGYKNGRSIVKSVNEMAEHLAEKIDRLRDEGHSEDEARSLPAGSRKYDLAARR